MPNFTPRVKPKLWTVVKATSGLSLIDRNGPQFTVTDHDEAKRIVDRLNRYERAMCKLQNEINEYHHRS